MIFMHFLVIFDKLKKTFFQHFPRQNPTYNPEVTWADKNQKYKCFEKFTKTCICSAMKIVKKQVKLLFSLLKSNKSGPDTLKGPINPGEPQNPVYDITLKCHNFCSI